MPPPEIIPQTESTEAGLDSAPTSTGVSGIVSDLCAALVQRDLSWVNRILDAAPSLAIMPHIAGFLPLDVAILTGDSALVKIVLAQHKISFEAAASDALAHTLTNVDWGWMLATEFCADSSIRIIRGGTPLHYACRLGNASIMELILTRCASFDRVDAQGKTPLLHFRPADAGSLEAMNIYTSAERKFRIDQAVFEASLTAAAQFVKRKEIDSLKTVLEAHPHLTAEAHPSQGWTLLHLAALNNVMEFVDLLLGIGNLQVNATDNWSASNEHNTIVTSNGVWVLPAAPPEHRCYWFTHPFHSTVNGCTALHYACLVGNMEMAESLLKSGADWTIKDSKGRLAKKYAEDAFGREKEEHFKRLCDEEDVRRKGNSAGPGLGEPAVAAAHETSREDDAGKSLEEFLGQKIVGQQGPVRAVASAIRLRENGWVDPKHPLVMLFLGSSGVGKTELAKQVALYLNRKKGTDETGDDLDAMEESSKLIRLDMSEFQEPHSVANLTGSPKGYVGYGDGGVLSSRLKKNPKAIVLLDEIEKAHPDVLTVFLQVFDDGRITDKKDGVVHCKGAIFIMTSNLGADEIKAASPYLRKLIEDTRDRPEEYHRVIDEFKRELHPVLKSNLRRDELLGRINEIVLFLPLNDEEIHSVVDNELSAWKRRALENHGIHVSWSTEVVRRLSKGYDINFGVRSVMGEVRRVAIQQLADAQIRGEIGKGWLAHLTLDEGDRVVIRLSAPLA